ncbi:energy transducer TonB [Nitrosomonas nitrosa]|uniref:energy transducer TonB n=1 Tax=Nitrosomonas nitrosa TaxID=52442 RepID=UPI0023F7C754|nr:energy transducer TonB [Nitrosomonas nitrosa]MCO6433463.1 energy transducer TonB [Nitrosomonas nitrosa]
MNQLNGWPIPVLAACLVHGAVTLLPVNFSQKNQRIEEAEITFRLVSLPNRSLSPSPIPPQFLPDKKPTPPKKELTQHKIASLPAKPTARPHATSKEEITSLESAAITDESAMQTNDAVETSKDPSSTQMPADPVMLSSELSVICPDMSMPSYPHISRQLGEQGELMLRLELDEKGIVQKVQIVNGSGYDRLDEAAIAAVKTWRCTPPVQNGQPARVIALQPFYFVLKN